MLLRRVIEHVNSQNWFAISIDFVIVVVGVFIGIQVSSWNDARVERQLSGSYMQRIQADLEDDLYTLEQRKTFWSSVHDEGVAALAYAEKSELKEGSAWKTVLGYFQASQIAGFHANDSTFDELKGAGQLRLLRDPSIRAMLVEYYAINSLNQAKRFFAP